MTPVRAVLAAVLAAIMLFAGSFLVARLSGRAVADFVEVLLGGWAPSLWCFLAAALAAAFGALAVLAAFLAFIAPDEEDDGPFRRRGFPKAAPILLIIVSLALVWFALRCAKEPKADAPIAVAIEPEAPPAEDIEEALDGGEALVVLDTQGPRYFFSETDFAWGFKDPIIRSGGHFWMSTERPFADETARALLCGKSWVAVTGSASEEGPGDRNAERSRLRAIAAVEAARRWVGRHPECGETAVFGVDLGQHAGLSADDTGATTAYQRRVMVIARDRNTGEGQDLSAAREELSGLLGDPAKRAQLYAGREFPAEPVILP
ncbi:MAG: hypothetical protein U5J99_14280 [Parvularculaceae bacterium]|nr:hypothetical protein [Parvularculaceae bacterium]